MKESFKLLVIYKQANWIVMWTGYLQYAILSTLLWRQEQSSLSIFIFILCCSGSRICHILRGLKFYFPPKMTMDITGINISLQNITRPDMEMPCELILAS